ncbi:hypothetical protein SteCoe_4245 [Stentor coeruleus]|uniref:Palmitoyltransferase n=1 Tax=Stentor coeruleus TaxID=5963 RepID=A0A1R2CV77_9CILI|nr:hypothetical protein SteCoe_4245 [Stentor coeruleus]
MEDMRIGGLFTLSPEKFGNAFIRLIGPALLIVLILLVTFMTYTYFSELLPYFITFTGPWLGMLITSLGLFLLFNIIINYYYCVTKGPGHPVDHPDYQRCKTCKGPKPQRAHHCSVCNRCVLKMDHHCPWIMNCVGHKNHRYFVLFLVYLTLGCFFMTCASYSRFSVKPRNSSAHVCFLLAFVFSIVLLLFTAWHVFLIFAGATTIELFGFYGDPENKDKYNFSRGSWRKNMEIVFGTTSLITAVMPSGKDLPYDGAYWPDTLHAI